MSPNEPNDSSIQRKRFLARLDPRFARLVRPLLTGLVITLCLFATYEVVERLWLSHVEMETLHLLHTLRGIFSSLVVAGVVGWMIIRSSPEFLAPAPADEAWTQQLRPTDAERTKTYARWFIAMRWIAVLVAGLLVVITVKIMGWLPGEVWWPLVLTVA